MTDNPHIVALLKEFASEASITRPEVGILVGLSVGQVAGIHNRHTQKIGMWPKLDPTRRANRRCQFPIGMPGTKDFRTCGEMRAQGDSLCCPVHKGMEWTPPNTRR